MSLSTLKRKITETDFATTTNIKKQKTSTTFRVKFPLDLPFDEDHKYFDMKKFYEPIDIKRFKSLLNCAADIFHTKRNNNWTGAQWELWFDSRRAHIQAIIQKYKPGDKAVVVTYQSSGNGSNRWGRVYPKGGLSAGEISGELRSWLLYDQWTALDIANCHPTIVYQTLSTHGIELKSLQRYCENRNPCLEAVRKTYGVDRDAAKLLYIRLLYGGTFEAWCKDNKVYDMEPTPFIKAFIEDCAHAAKVIVAQNATLKSTVVPNEKSIKKKKGPGRPKKDAPKEKPQKEVASDDQVVSNWCQTIECKVLKIMYDFLVSKSIVNDDHPECMLRYDGIDILLSALVGFDLQTILRELEEVITLRTGLQLKMDEKPYVLPEIAKEIEAQLDFASKVDENDMGALNVRTLIDLETYPAQKWYFEKFISKIINSGDYVWTQRRYMETHSEFEGSKMMPYDHCVSRTHKELYQSFGHVSTSVPGDDKERQFMDVWLKDSEIRFSNRVDFLPYNEGIERSPGKDYGVHNLFNGFTNPKDVTVDENTAPLTDAFHYIGLQLCENNPVHYQFFWNALVKLFKHPRQRLGQAFVFQGKTQGTGFDVYFNTIGRLLGDNHYTNTSKVGDILGDHAEGLEHRLLVVMNEIKFNNMKNAEEQLKTLITDTTHIVNPKCVRPYRINLYALMVFVTNHRDAISMDVGANERRNNVFYPSNKTIATDEWGYSTDDWTYWVSVFKSPMFLAALYKEVMATDISSFDPNGHRKLIQGKEYFRASEFNSALHSQFMAHMLRDGKFNGYAIKSGQMWQNVKEGSPIPCYIHASVSDGLEVAVPANELRSLFKAWLEVEKGMASSRGSTTKWRDLCQDNGPYADVVDIVKNNNITYRFNTKKVWMVLVKKKWVVESYEYHREQLPKDLTMDVNPRFEAMATLHEDSENIERGTTVDTAVDAPVDTSEETTEEAAKKARLAARNARNPGSARPLT